MTVIPAVIAGPAILTRAGQVWYSEGDIEVDVVQETWEPQTSRFGGIGPRPKSFPVITVSFKPDGQVTAARMTAAFPYSAADVGKSIFTASNVPLVINSVDGNQYTFARSGLSGTPSIYLGVDKTAFDGSLKFTCLAGVGLDPTAAASILAIEAIVYPGDAGYDDTKMITPGFTAAYGAGTGLTAMDSMDGFRFDCPVRTQPISVNRFGTVNEFLVSVGPAVCRFTPSGMTDAIWLTIANADGATVAVPGSAASTTDLVVTGAGLVVTMAKAWVSGSKLGFGVSKERHGELAFQSRTVFTAGVPAKLLTITGPA